MMMLIASACRDHRQYPPDGDAFAIHREQRQHLAFGAASTTAWARRSLV